MLQTFNGGFYKNTFSFFYKIQYRKTDDYLFDLFLKWPRPWLRGNLKNTQKKTKYILYY